LYTVATHGHQTSILNMTLNMTDVHPLQHL
jgi:hypothetical protein